MVGCSGGGSRGVDVVCSERAAHITCDHRTVAHSKYTFSALFKELDGFSSGHCASNAVGVLPRSADEDSTWRKNVWLDSDRKQEINV